MSIDKSKFVIRRAAAGMGLGLYAMRDFKKGEYLLDYTGKKVTTEVADTLTTRYLFEIDKDWTIDGSSRSNTARYVNHSCVPNVEADIVGDRIMYATIKPVKKGEELLIDYGEEYFDEYLRPKGCLCGTKKCRKPAKAAALSTVAAVPAKKARTKRDPKRA